jgi:hypothetical protein
MYPCFITVFNQLTWPRRMIDDIIRFGLEPIIIDHGSTYPPLLEWYKSGDCKAQIVLTGRNFGCYGFWSSGRSKPVKDYYFVTDCDLDLSGVPSDAVNVMTQSLRANPTVSKVGLSLEINDVPADWPLYDALHKWEDQYWTKRTPDGHWDANVGATFAVYHPSHRFPTPPSAEFYRAVRTDRPYTARHLPWYLNLDAVDEEFRYYMSKLSPDSSVWTTAMIKELKKRGQL